MGNVADFLVDLEAVCRKHGLSLSHEDRHGLFEVVPFNERDMAWLRDAVPSPAPRSDRRADHGIAAVLESLDI